MKRNAMKKLNENERMKRKKRKKKNVEMNKGEKGHWEVDGEQAK